MNHNQQRAQKHQPLNRGRMHGQFSGLKEKPKDYTSNKRL